MKIARKVVGSLACAAALSAMLAVPAFAAEEGVTTMATSAPLNMRSAADIDSSIITTIPKGTSVQVFGMTNSGWYDVEYNGQRGHSWYQYLDFEGTASSTVHDGHITDMFATAPLNVRAQPNTSSTILGSLAKDEAIAVTAKNDGWFTVVYEGKTAYCNGQWLAFGQTGADACQAGTTSSVMNDMTASTALNVRSQPNTSSTILGSYKQGETVKVIGSEADGRWYKVQFGEQTGYVCTDWLK